MVAPIDAVAKIEVEGETITLRLNFRTIALAEAEGIDLFDPASLNELTTVGTARLVRCLASVDHPGFTDETGLAIALRHGAEMTQKLFELMKSAAGKGGEGENPQTGASAPTA